MASAVVLPDGISARGVRLAEEAAITALQQAGELSIREAADQLGLTYEGYLALLARMGLPASNVDGEDAEGMRFLLERARRIGASSR